jgi:hypothetical protein
MKGDLGRFGGVKLLIRYLHIIIAILTVDVTSLKRRYHRSLTARLATLAKVL